MAITCTIDATGITAPSLEEKVYYVYALVRPDTGSIFYIGKGSGDRAEHHIKWPDRQCNPHKANIIRKLDNLGSPARVEIIIDGLSESQAYEAESVLIKKIGRHPMGPLVNLTDGGDGLRGLTRTPAHKAAISKALRGMKKNGAALDAALANLEKGRLALAVRPPDARAESARKSLSRKPPERRSEWQKKAWETRVKNNPEEAEWVRALGLAHMTPERQAAAVKAAASLSADKKRARALKSNSSRTPEQRVEIARKSWVTRRKNMGMNDVIDHMHD